MSCSRATTDDPGEARIAALPSKYRLRSKQNVLGNIKFFQLFACRWRLLLSPEIFANSMDPDQSLQILSTVLLTHNQSSEKEIIAL